MPIERSIKMKTFAAILSATLFCTLCHADDTSKAISLAITPSRLNKQGYDIVISNNSTHPVSYSGYGGEDSMQPIYAIEVLKNGKWIDKSPGRCGMGMGPCHLKPGQIVRIPFHGLLSSNQENFPFKISIVIQGNAARNSKSDGNKRLYSKVYLWKNGKIEQSADPK